MDFMDLPISEWKTFDTQFALHSFVPFWKENERLISEAAEEAELRDGPKWKPRTRDELGEFHMERGVARHLYDEVLTPTFRHSCVVMLFSIVERELLRLVRNLEKQNKTAESFKLHQKAR